MQRAWLVVGMVAVCAGCALDEQLDDVAARKSLKPCKGKKHDKPRLHEPPCFTTTSVGATGGVVEHPNGVTLSVPAGALDHDVAISVLDEGAPGPENTTMFSPVFTFEPDGTLFARPVQVQFDVDASVAEATVYWTRSTATGIEWDRIAASVADGIATAQITHFSAGGAGQRSGVHDLQIIHSRTWDRLDRQEIEYTDFATGAAIAHAPGGDLLSEAWVDKDGPVLGHGMIRSIPAGEMWIQLGDKWIFTSLAATPVIDLSTEKYGTRGRATPNPNLPRPIAIHVDGAAQTSAEDAVELLVPDANAFYFGFPEATGAPIVPVGVTEFDLDWDLSSPFAVNNFITAEDTAFVAQMVPKDTAVPGLSYRQMTKIGIASLVASDVLDVTLGDLPATSSRAYTIVAGEYQSMFATSDPIPDPLGAPANGQSSGWTSDARVVNLGALDITSGSFGLQGVAGGRNVGAIGATADFAYMNLPSSVMSGTFDTGALSYGVPGDKPWDTYAALAANAFFAIQLRCPVDAIPCSTPGGWARQAVNNAVGVGYTDARLVDATQFAPTIGPAIDIRINGVDAHQFQSGVGLQPAISWSPTTSVSSRALELPQAYHVGVFRYVLDSASGQWRTRRVLVADFTTTHTSMTLPVALVAGDVYSIIVSASKREPTAGVSPIQEPFRFRYPASDWATASAPFTP